MFEVGVVKRFEASHSLQGDFGPAREVHSHDYRVEVTVRGTHLREDGTLIDIGFLSNEVDRALAELAGRKLNDLAGFEATNSTAEAVSKYLADKISTALLDSVIPRSIRLRALTVRVWESDEAFASYESRLDHS